jgi:hypothetical protein
MNSLCCSKFLKADSGARGEILTATATGYSETLDGYSQEVTVLPVQRRMSLFHTEAGNLLSAPSRHISTVRPTDSNCSLQILTEFF